MKKKILFFILFSLFTLFFSTAQNLKKPLKQTLKESLYEETMLEESTKTDKDVIIAANDMFPSFEKNTGLLDIPLASGIHRFSFIVNEVGNIVVDLCILCCFLCIVFNCFKLWFSTTEVKKFFVDIIYKLIICIILLLVYVPFTNQLISLASVIGINISGGYDKINDTYVLAYAKLEKDISKGFEQIMKNIYVNAAKDADGNRYVTDELFNELRDCAMSEEEIKAWAEEKGLKIAKPVYINGKLNNYKNEDGKHLLGKSWGGGYYTTTAFNKNVKNAIKNAIKNDKEDVKKQKERVVRINALLEVLTAEEIEPSDLQKSVDEQTKTKKESALGTLKKMYFSPYLVNSKGENTIFLSGSKLLKTIAIMNDAVALSSCARINEAGEVEDNPLNPRGVWTFKGVLKMIEGLLFKWGMQICCIIVMSEYILTILEFYLVRGLASLLIPFFFLDVTKSYAENLIKIFFTYFFKVLITVFVCFFSMGMFLDTAVVNITADKDSFSIILYLSTLTIGTMFCTKIPQILSTLLSGNPSMGWGTVVETARGAAQGLHMAQHAVQSAKKVGSRIAHAGQAGIRGAMGVKATLDGAAAAKASTLDNARLQNSLLKMDQPGAAGMTEKQMNAAANASWWKTVGDSMKQSVGDSLYKAFTGQNKKRNAGDGGTLKFGQTFEDGVGRQQQADFGDMKKQAKAKGESIGKEKVDKFFKGKDGTGGYNGAAMSTITDAQNNQNSQTQKKQWPGTQEFGKTNVRGREAGLPD